jgi:hypothetical protein
MEEQNDILKKQLRDQNQQQVIALQKSVTNAVAQIRQKHIQLISENTEVKFNHDQLIKLNETL